jgi:hypothetical protein
VYGSAPRGSLSYTSPLGAAHIDYGADSQDALRKLQDLLDGLRVPHRVHKRMLTRVSVGSRGRFLCTIDCFLFGELHVGTVAKTKSWVHYWQLTCLLTLAACAARSQEEARGMWIQELGLLTPVGHHQRRCLTCLQPAGRPDSQSKAACLTPHHAAAHLGHMQAAPLLRAAAAAAVAACRCACTCATLKRGCRPSGTPGMHGWTPRHCR